MVLPEWIKMFEGPLDMKFQTYNVHVVNFGSVGPGAHNPGYGLLVGPEEQKSI